MGSYYYGQEDVCSWIRQYYRRDARILDVGACDGNWRRLLPEYPNMDAVEAYGPNLGLLHGYRAVYHADIRDFAYSAYDLIILGDIIEHLTVPDAQKVLTYAAERCSDMVVAVPFLYHQGAIYGNPFEVHIQDDLTAENFAVRYPELEILLDTGHNYCYYHKRTEP